MEIEIVWGAGEGKTALAAFDAALQQAGIHNYNLVSLSSVAPPDAEVIDTARHEPRWDVGSVVGAVMAAKKSTVVGETIAAGLGWAMAPQGGVFFEETAESTENVETRLRRGLDSAKTHRMQWEWTNRDEMRVIDHTVADNGAVVVAALYGPL